MFAEYVLYKKHDNIFYCHIKRDWNLLFLFELFENGGIRNTATTNVFRINTYVYAAVIHDVVKGEQRRSRRPVCSSVEKRQLFWRNWFNKYDANGRRYTDQCSNAGSANQYELSSGGIVNADQRQRDNAAADGPAASKKSRQVAVLHHERQEQFGQAAHIV